MSQAIAVGALAAVPERETFSLTGEQRRNLALASLGSLLEFSFLQTQYGFERGTVFSANSVALLVLALVCPLWGRIADKIGYGWVVLGIGVAGLAAATFLFFRDLPVIAANPSQLLRWYVAFSMLMATAATIPALSALPFPTEVKQA